MFIPNLYDANIRNLVQFVYMVIYYQLNMWYRDSLKSFKSGDVCLWHEHKVNNSQGYLIWIIEAQLDLGEIIGAYYSMDVCLWCEHKAGAGAGVNTALMYSVLACCELFWPAGAPSAFLKHLVLHTSGWKVSKLW